MSQFVEQGHLGGYIRGGDPATFYFELWAWLVDEYGVRSVIDVGCGEGHALDFFAGRGCHTLGIEGVPQGHERILHHDYTTGPRDLRVDALDDRGFITGWKQEWFDLCWSCEFVEHVEERFVPNFLPTFACADLVLMTHASPGQPGYHHVNCRDAEYWKGAMAAIGYAYDEILTATTRELARANTDPHNHYVRSGLAFGRRE